MEGLIALFFLIIIVYFGFKIANAVKGTSNQDEILNELRAIHKAMEGINRRLDRKQKHAARTVEPEPEQEAQPVAAVEVAEPVAPQEEAPQKAVAMEEAAPAVAEPVVPQEEAPQEAAAMEEATPSWSELLAPQEEAPQAAAMEEAAPAVAEPVVPQEEAPQEAVAVVATAVEEAAPATPPPVEPPPPPREPSALELRLLALRNWFVYGKAAGIQEGDAVEKMLATTWLLRAGILVILITSVFLLKLSIERGLLAPEGRVALSYLAGAALLYGGLRHKMRQEYWSLGQALVGIGLGMFYFSSYAMVSMYHLVPPLAGGAVMVLITVTSGVLADKLASLPIAMVSMLGGFATPLLLNTGVKNFPGLAAYLLLLGAGVLWLANRRNWQQLTWLAMLFSYGIFGMAYRTHFIDSDFACYQTALVLFFILYSTSVFIHNIRLKLAAGALEIIGLLGNSLFFFWYSSAALLRVSNGDRLALAPLTIGLALYYLAHAAFLLKRRVPEDRNLLLIFCALCGFYLSLTAPVLLTGEWLGVAWALQGLMMLWLGYKLESRFIRGCAWVLYALTLFRLCAYDFFAYTAVNGGSFWLAALARCLRFGIPVACLALGARLVKANARPDDGDATAAAVPRLNPVAGAFLTIAFALGFLFLLLETTADLRHGLPFLWSAGFNLVWIFAILLALKMLRGKIAGWWWTVALILSGGLVIVLFVDFCIPALWECCHPEFMWSYSIGTMVNTLVLVGGIWYMRRMLPDDKGEWGRQVAVACNIAWPLLLFFHSTREMQTIIDNVLPGLEGGGISVLWSLFAFALVFVGLRKSNRMLRCLGLIGFAIIVLKVFLMDMRRLDALFRVGAFLAFGILLMGAAFVYLKFWRNKEEK